MPRARGANATPARVMPLLRELGPVAAAALRAAGRRIRHGPKRSEWSWGLELGAAVMRDHWVRHRDTPLAEWRQTGDAVMSRLPKPPGVRFDRVNANGVASVLVAPETSHDARKVVLYVHGGGFCVGSPTTHRVLTAAIARQAGLSVLVPDYRLAPEHPYPAALEDVSTAFRWLREQGYDEIIAIGDSAGGNLVFGLSLTQSPGPHKLVAISPLVDFQLGQPSFLHNYELDYLHRETVERFSRAYLDGRPDDAPTVSPTRGDLTKLPPTLIQAGGAEALVDQITELAERARAAGAPVELSIHPGMVHVWHLFFDFAPEARAAVDEIVRYIQRSPKGAHA